MASSSDRPINYNAFDPVPQRLVVTVNGLMPYHGDNETFSSGFDSINTTAFDTNFPAELNVDCGLSGSLYMSSGPFAHMSYIQHLKFKNCKIHNIPDSAFSGVVDLDFFGLEGGYIDVVSPNAMAGLSVEKMTTATHTFPRQQGKFEILYSPFTSQIIPNGMFYSWKNLTSITITGSDVNSLTLDVFKYNTKLRHIDLSDNGFETIPNNMLSGMDSLADITMYNIAWQCTCADLWFIPYTLSNNITIVGDNMCSNINGTTTYKYYYDNCLSTDPCDGTTGVAVGGHCVSALSLTILCLSLMSAILIIVDMVIVLSVRREITTRQTTRKRAVGQWNKVLDSMIKSKRRNQN